jgi:hypothetical protein
MSINLPIGALEYRYTQYPDLRMAIVAELNARAKAGSARAKNALKRLGITDADRPAKELHKDRPQRVAAASGPCTHRCIDWECAGCRRRYWQAFDAILAEKGEQRESPPSDETLRLRYSETVTIKDAHAARMEA